MISGKFLAQCLMVSNAKANTPRRRLGPSAPQLYTLRCVKERVIGGTISTTWLCDSGSHHNGPSGRANLQSGSAPSRGRAPRSTPDLPPQKWSG